MASRETRDWIAAGLHHPERDVGKMDDVPLPEDRDLQKGEDLGGAPGGDPLKGNGQGVEEDVGERNHEEKIEQGEAEAFQRRPPPVPGHDSGQEKENRDLLHEEEPGEAPGGETEDPHPHQERTQEGGTVAGHRQVLPVEVDQKEEDEGHKKAVGV